MSESTLIHSMRLEGFRAFLDPVTFDFSHKRCLAVFAPNGNGKSSIIDALEFMFSDDGSLERLGKRAVGNSAGFAALAHNLAEAKNVEPSVTLTTISGKECKVGARVATGSSRKIPDVAQDLKSLFVVSPLIRGYTLRSFVESHTPEERYSDVANWLQLGPLVNAQKSIRTLKTQLNAAANEHSARTRIERQLATEVELQIVDLRPANILNYLNRVVIAPLDETLIFDGITKGCEGYEELINRVTDEENRLGLAGLRQIRNAVSAIWDDAEGTEFRIVKGAIPEFTDAVSRMAVARCKEKAERKKAANTVFDTVWNAAAPLFEKDAQFPDKCPVCATPLVNTAAGSGEAIGEHIQKHLSELSSYSRAKREYDETKAQVTQSHARLKAALPVLAGLLRDQDSELKTAVDAFQSIILDWADQDVEAPKPLVELLNKLLDKVDDDIIKIESKQGDHTFAKAKAKIDRIFDLITERRFILRTEIELNKLNDGLTEQSRYISAQIRVKVQDLLNMLQAPMNEIYKAIQGPIAKPIRLELPPEADTNQQRLNLVIDFAENRKGVQPSGYLSDSQIHSIALALRLAAIKVFNTDAPIIALDDIVTSYDADHRRTIAGLIATGFDQHQIIITTHDERFYSFLKDQMQIRAWQFCRIIGFDPQRGPRIAEHKITDQMIEARWSGGMSAANEMRQSEEEWLLEIGRGFGVSLRIRPLERAYSYERSELASALASMLKEIKLVPALTPGVNNPFLDSLVRGTIENFGSHFQDAPYGDGSIGDEKARWEEFKVFHRQFTCLHCGHRKFKRHGGLKRPVCARETCEKQFEFAPIGKL